MFRQGLVVAAVVAAGLGVTCYTAVWVKHKRDEARAAAAPAEEAPSSGLVAMERPPARVGEIFVLGNHHTPQEVILEHVPLSPGQVLSYPDLVQAEKNLERSGLFVVDPRRGIRPHVEIMESAEESEFKSILIHVYEKE
jgi:outer membrane protein assembly factor BamA